MGTTICSALRPTVSKALVLFAVAVLAMTVMAPRASAQTCMQDEFDSFNMTTKTLGCTAGDVSIAAIEPGSVKVFQGGTGDKCLAGSPFSFTATFEIKTTSSKTRSNIGIFFGTKQAGALTGTCSQAILSPLHSCANGTAMCGSSEYEELDGPINGETPPPAPGGTAGCGDTTSADSSPDFGAGTQQATLEVDGVTCPTSGTSLTLPVCTSWYQPASGMPVCESPGPSYPWQPQAIPGTSSKCSCGTLSVPVQPITPSVTVAKSCNTTKTTGTNQTSCDEGAGDASGNNVTYHVVITNTTPANEGGVVIDQICDNVYGTIYKSASFTGTACATGSIGTNGSLISTTCPPNPNDIANQGSGTCDFVAHQNENLTEMDTVTVSGHSDIVTTTTFGPTSSNPVTVTSEESPSTASTTKGLISPPAINVCVTVRYTIDVANGSAADENLTLSALNDTPYGDITSVHGNILGTTCGVQAGNSGLGTLENRTVVAPGVTPGANQAPGGSFATGDLPVGGPDYKCWFDGQFCGAPVAGVEEFGTGTCDTNPADTTFGKCIAGQPSTTSCSTSAQCDLTCTGISQTDTTTGTITGDEGETVTQTITGLNLTECVQNFTSPHTP